jgi:outer membrane lipoprotein-sorting protein
MINGKDIILVLSLLMLVAISQICLAEEPDPTLIIDRMVDAMRGDASYAEMTMRIERPRYTREVAMRSWSKGRKASLVLITAPARDRGTVYLMRDNDIWTYDPRIDRITRLPSSMLAQSWMGSDFTNDDLIRDSDPVKDYQHRFLHTEEYQGYQSYVIDMIPKPDAPIVWGKVRVWVSSSNYLQLRAEHYDQRGDLVNSMEFDQITQFGARELPARITVLPAGKQNERTVLTYEDVSFDIDIDDDFFSRATMQRLR